MSCFCIHLSTSLERKHRLDTGLEFLCISSNTDFFRSGVTIAVFHSSLKSPLVSERLTICVIVCKHAGRIPLKSVVGMMSSLLLHLPLSPYVFDWGEWCKLFKFWYFVSVGLYVDTILNCSCIFLIFSRKNVVKSLAISSAVFPGGIGFSALFLVSLLMILEIPLVIFLFSLTCFHMTCFLW